MNIFIIESPSPNDLLERRNEAESLKSVCEMFEHKIAEFLVKDKDELKSCIGYLGELELSKKEYVCFHFSCHGNDDGLWFGKDFVSWSKMSKIIKPLLNNKSLKNRYSFIISACGANEQTLSTKLSEVVFDSETKIYPPEYIIIYDESDVIWSDALLSWTILYHQLSDEQSIDKKKLQLLMKRMKTVGFGSLMYFRWEKDDLQYKRYRPKELS